MEMLVYLFIGFSLAILYRFIRGPHFFGIVTHLVMATMGSFTGGYLYTLLGLDYEHGYGAAFTLAALTAILFMVLTDTLRVFLDRHPRLR